MTHKKFLLIVSFLSLFISQQVRANAQFLSNNAKASQAVSVQASELSQQLYITVAHLDQRTNFPITDANGKIKRCHYKDTAYGCAETGSGGYPYKHNPRWFDVESEYIPNVLPREMDVKTNPPTLAPPELPALRGWERSLVRYMERLPPNPCPLLHWHRYYEQCKWRCPDPYRSLEFGEP